MKFESALDLQARIFREVFDFQPLETAAAGGGPPGPDILVHPAVFEPDRRSLKARRSEEHRFADDIALGVSGPDAHSGSAKLAVLVQDRRDAKSTVVDEIGRRARGEAEVIYIGRQRPLWTLQRCDPIRIGASISPATSDSVGTLGCFCRATLGGRDCILSNNHVIADINRAPLGTRIVQQGLSDGGVDGADVVADLVKFVPIEFGGMPNAVDAAIAALTPHGRAEDRSSILNSDDPPAAAFTLQPAQVAEAPLGAPVHKTGRTTRHTSGRITSVAVTNFVVHYPGVGIARFDGQIQMQMAMEPARPFARPGDSGSLIVDGEGRPVALLFAGSASGGAGNLGIATANPISIVLAQLGIALI